MSSAAAKNGKRKGETLEFKSPAEFFAENQNIAGFDNAGKALYTTIREFVENALDAAESAGRLPDISVTVEEMDAKTFNRLRGEMHGIGSKMDASGGLPATKRKKSAVGDDSLADADADGPGGDEAAVEAGAGADGGAGKKGAAVAAKKKEELSYYRITCRDNGACPDQGSGAEVAARAATAAALRRFRRRHHVVLLLFGFCTVSLASRFPPSACRLRHAARADPRVPGPRAGGQ